MPPFVTADQLRRALATDAARKPDIVKATYVGPDGARGKHIVKLNCSEREIAVSGPPHQTFKPGTSVLLASHQNGQHRTMLAYPVGARGASQYQAATQHRRASMAPGFGPTACPISITGKTYLGLYRDGSDLMLWGYEDGSYVEDVATGTYPTGSIYAGPDYHTACKVPGSQVIAFMAAVEGVQHVYSWDYGTNTLVSTGVDNESVVCATANYLYTVGTSGQVVRMDLDLGSPTDIGDAYSNQAIWVANDSALYSQRDDSGQKFGHHNGATPADPWTLTSRSLIGDGGSWDTFTAGSAVIGLDTLVRYHRLGGAGTAGSVTTLHVVSGAETPLWPAHWLPSGSGNRALLGVGNDEVTIYDSPSYVRLALADYTGVATTCAWPAIEVDQHPVALDVPGAFIPLD